MFCRPDALNYPKWPRMFGSQGLSSLGYLFVSLAVCAAMTKKRSLRHILARFPLPHTADAIEDQRLKFQRLQATPEQPGPLDEDLSSAVVPLDEDFACAFERELFGDSEEEEPMRAPPPGVGDASHALDLVRDPVPVPRARQPPGHGPRHDPAGHDPGHDPDGSFGGAAPLNFHFHFNHCHMPSFTGCTIRDSEIVTGDKVGCIRGMVYRA